MSKFMGGFPGNQAAPSSAHTSPSSPTPVLHSNTPFATR